MKKIIKLSAIFVFVIVSVIAINIIKRGKDVDNESEIIDIDKNSVEYNGWLRTSDEKIVNEKGEIVQLRGVSTHGIQWFHDLYTKKNIESLKDELGINVFRVAMYTSPEEDGYISNPTELKEIAYSIIDEVINLDMYVIIDWHILKDNNPQMYQTQAEEFFDEVSKKYQTCPNVIYEICNEPNKQVTWKDNVKPYAESVCSIIRNNSPKSMIIVGSPNWCTSIRDASKDRLEMENIVYACHFYAGTSGKPLRDEIEYCLENKMPIFVSECGITDGSGQGKLFEESFYEWVDFMESNNLSWVFWSFSNKEESSSIISSSYRPGMINEYGETEDIKNYLSETGKILKKIFGQWDGSLVQIIERAE